MRISYCSSDVCSSDLLQYLLIGAVEAGIDKAVRRSLPLDGDVLEETFACRRAFKDEGRGQEDRRLQRAFGKRGIEPVAHHQRGGLQLAAAEFQDIGLRAAPRRRNRRGTGGIVRAGEIGRGAWRGMGQGGIEWGGGGVSTKKRRTTQDYY